MASTRSMPLPFIPVLLGRTLTTELPALLKQAMDDPDITVATVCGGSLVLAMAGLLEGRHATTHHMGLGVLDATGAHAVRARIVDDGDLLSARPFADQSLTIPLHKQEEHQHVRRRHRRRRPGHRPREYVSPTPRRALADA